MNAEALRQRPAFAGWTARRLRAVADAYRHAAGEGLDRPACLRLGAEAFVAAGGARDSAHAAVSELVAVLAEEMPGWLYGPAQAWLERQAALVRRSAPLRLAA